MNHPPQDTGERSPIACDMSNAPDTPGQRREEYRRLFTDFLARRERSEAGITFLFQAGRGVAEWVSDLAEREQACCPFFTSAVTATEQEVRWEMSVTDDEVARQCLGEFYRLPETLGAPQESVGVIPLAEGQARVTRTA